MAKTALGIRKEFSEKPYTLWDLRGKVFTIVEDLPSNKPIREKMEQSKKNPNAKPYLTFLIKVEEGMFQKDLSLYESELMNIFMAAPATLVNYRGCTFEVSNNLNKNLKYQGTVAQDMQGNRLADRAESPKDAPGQANASTLDSRIAQFREAIKFTASIGTTVNAAVAIKIAETIEPGNALGLISSAKNAGEIIEKAGIFTEAT